MPAPPRLEPDAVYHIWNRGVNHATIFQNDDNYRTFLKLYAFHVEPAAETYAYCLLPNHFHLLVRTRTDEGQLAYRRQPAAGPVGLVRPSPAFSNLLNAYVRAYNRPWSATPGR